MRRRVFLLALALLAGCGEEPAPTSRVPRDPDAALAWVREAAEADDDRELRARLAEWPVDAPAFRAQQSTRVVLTWRLRHALGDDDTIRALEDYRRLKERFGGAGLTPEGVTLEADWTAAAMFDALLDAARGHVEGANANQASANDMLGRANAMLDGVSDDARAKLEAAQRWVLLRRIQDARLGVPSSGPPQIVLLTDDFALGEAVLPGVLKRWARDGKSYGLEIRIVPLWRDFVRLRTRRIPATTQEEGAAIQRRAKEIGATVMPTAERSEALERELGLRPKQNALFVVDRDGIIVARMTGFTIDPRELEAVVQRVLSR